MNRRPDEPTTGQVVHDTLDEMMPWLSSVVFHLGLIVLALFAVWMTTRMDEPEPMLVVRPHVQDLNRPPLEPSEQVLDDAAASTIRRATPTQTTPREDFEKLVGVLGGGRHVNLPIQPVANPSPIGPAPRGTGSTTIFEPPAGTAFSSVVYVIDASGSLVSDLGFVIDELKRSIRQLGPAQKFTVIFFQRDLAIEVPPRGLKPATAAVKARIIDWVSGSRGNIVPGGTSNPLAALAVGLRYRPDALFVLSDNITGRGRYEVDRRVLLDEIARLNADHRTQMHTIQFLYPDPLKTLQRIAGEHGGSHRFIREIDMMGSAARGGGAR